MTKDENGSERFFCEKFKAIEDLEKAYKERKKI